MKNLTAPPLYTSGYPLMSLPPQKMKMPDVEESNPEKKIIAKTLRVKKPNIADSPLNWDENWFGNYE